MISKVFTVHLENVLRFVVLASLLVGLGTGAVPAAVRAEPSLLAALAPIELATFTNASVGDIGAAVALHGDVAVVGAPLTDFPGNPDQGAAYVYVYNPNTDTWDAGPVLTGSLTGGRDLFGNSVATDGDWIVVGAKDDDDGKYSAAGGVYVFKRDAPGATTWTEVQLLRATDGGVHRNDRFGTSVAVEGDTLVVGAALEDPGSNNAGKAYVFKLVGGQWTGVKVLSAGTNNNKFGTSVALSGTTLVVGAPEVADGLLAFVGAAYVYERNEGGADNWALVQTLSETPTVANAFFGMSVAINGDLLAVGAPSSIKATTPIQGKAHLYERDAVNPNAWNLISTVVEPVPDALPSYFGTAVAIGPEVFAVGAPGNDIGADQDRGGVFVFLRNEGGADAWGFSGEVIHSTAAKLDKFGNAVDLYGAKLLVGDAAKNSAFLMELAYKPVVNLNNMGTYTFTEDLGPVAITGAVSITDDDSSAFDKATVQITNAQDGAMELLDAAASALYTDVYDPATHTLTITPTSTMTPAQFAAALSTVTYENTSQNPTTGVTRTVNFIVDDGAVFSDTVSSSVDVVSVNDAPTVTVPAPLAFDEGGSTAVEGISVADLEAAVIKVTVAATHGTVLFNGTTAASVEMTGNIADVNTALAGVMFYPETTDYYGPASVAVTADDLGATGTGGALTGTDSVVITVNPVNDPPAVTVPGVEVSTSENVPVDLTPVSVSDIDAGTVYVKITAVHGTVTFNGATGAMVEMTDTLANVNAALALLSFAPTASYNGPASVTVFVSDLGNTGSGNVLTDTAIIDINVGAVADAPVLGGPSTATMAEDSPYTSLGALTLTDPDTDDSYSLTISASSGMLKSGAEEGATISFTGNLAAMQAALTGLTFMPDADFNGEVIVAIDIEETTTPFLTDSKTVTVTVTAVNDGPSVTAPDTEPIVIVEDNPLAFDGANTVSVSDVDAATVQVTVTAVNGTVQFNGASGASRSMTGSVSAVNTALAALTFTPTLNYFGDGASVTIAISDLGNTGTGGVLTDSATVTIHVTGVNDTPAITAPATATINEDAIAASLGAITVSDVEDGPSFTATVEVATGSLSMDGSSGLTVSKTGTLAEVNAALATLTYTPVANSNGTVMVTITALEVAAGLESSHEITVTVTAVNDAPVNTFPETGTVDEDGELALAAADVAVEDIDAATVRVTLSATNGTVSLPTAGLDIVSGAVNTATITVRGTLAAINTALDSLKFKPTANYYGLASLIMSTNDEGSSGTGGAKADSSTMVITVNPVVDTTQTHLTVDPGVLYVNTPFTLYFSVTSGAGVPEGTVTVTVDGDAKCTDVALDAEGKGTCTVSIPSEATYAFTATYTSTSTDFSGSHDTDNLFVSLRYIFLPIINR